MKEDVNRNTSSFIFAKRKGDFNGYYNYGNSYAMWLYMWDVVKEKNER